MLFEVGTNKIELRFGISGPGPIRLDALQDGRFLILSMMSVVDEP